VHRRAILLVGLALSACSSRPEVGPDYQVGSGTPSGGSGESPPPDEGSPSPGNVVTEDSGPSDPDAGPGKPPPPIDFTGALAATAKVPFGGSPYCNYDVTLKQVAVDVHLLASGDVADATVTDTMVEDAPGCQYPPQNPSNQSFAFASSEKIAGGVKVTFTGAQDNKPATALVMTITTSPPDAGADAASADGYPATLTWNRTDQPAPLAWKVTAKITLRPK
jgi:hypothetical protein